MKSAKFIVKSTKNQIIILQKAPILQQVAVAIMNEDVNPGSVSTQISSAKNEVCTMELCTEDADPYVLRCTNCKRRVHYKCASLPLYQLQLFINPKNCAYVCRSCVNITEDLTDILDEDELKTQRIKISSLEEDVSSMKQLSKPTKKKQTRINESAKISIAIVDTNLRKRYITLTSMLFVEVNPRQRR